MTQTTLAGHIRVNISRARALFNAGHVITMYPSNVNDGHIFQGWNLGCDIVKSEDTPDFDALLNSFSFHMEPELGRYVKFLARREKFETV